jgi:phosphatidylinositol-3-phosphatase
MEKFKHPLARIGALLAMTAFLAAPMAMSASASTQSSMTFTPLADAYVSASYPSTNYGSLTRLRVDGSPDVHSYLRFSVSGLGGLPILNATLRIYANSASSSGLTAKTVSDNSWGETTITYSNMPALGTTLTTSGAVAAGTWVNMDVSAYVKAEGTYSLGVITPGSTAISLASRESGADAPQLILTLGSTTSSSTPSPTPISTATLNPTPGATPTSGSIKHVIIIVMENKSYSQVWNTSSSPYITSLGKSYIRTANSYATGHPSLPNYLELTGGSNFGITTDCSPSSSCHVNASSVADKLEAKGLTWKAYMESMPSACYLTTSGTYAPKHNPFVYFDDIRTNSTRCKSRVVPFSAFSTDLATASATPNYAFISPNLCNDMHDCSVSTGDTWLKNHVPAILNSPACTVDKCLVALTWDEDSGSSGNHILTIFAGSAAKTGGLSTSVKYTHYSLLRTVEYIYGLPTLTANDAAASPMTDMLR